MSDQQVQQKIIEAYVKSYNQFDVAGMSKHLHQDVAFQNVPNGEITLELEGIEAFRAQAEQAKALFRSRQQTVTDMQFDDDTVEVTINYQGMLAQDLPNGLKAGDTLQLKGKSIFTFAEGKVIKLTDES